MKNLVMILFLISSFLYAESIQRKEVPQSVKVLESEKKALELKLEAYQLKKKLIELEKFFERERLEQKEHIEHEKALMKFKHELRTKRKRVNYISRAG